VRTTEGAWIIDHKTDSIADPALSCLAYAPQLDAYAAALEAAGIAVAGTAIHWIRRGEVVLVSRAAAAAILTQDTVQSTVLSGV
jgi:hypothetical protein